MKILILGGGLQGLCCGKSFYNKGYIVDIVSNDLQIRKSKFFNNIYSNINPTDDSCVYDLLGKECYDVLIPMGDVVVSFLSKNKNKIESIYGCKCACPNYDMLSVVEDKNTFMEFCDKNNIPHPTTLPLNSETIEHCIREIGFPSLIKPNYSVGARGITKVDTKTELEKKYLEVIDKFGTCTLQEFIDNNDYYYNVMLYRSRNGNILAYTIIKIVRMYPIDAGSSSCCISVENDELLKICKDCLDKLNWVGIADFDVLQRLDNGEYKIIELNPRVPASLKAANISGINFPEIIALDTIGKSVPEYIYCTNKTMRYLGIDIMWFLKSSKRFKTIPSWFAIFGKNIYYQDIYKEDISTWWTWLVEGLKKIGKRNKRLR
ncbi:MAG: ATP-grasp domain-containing protein [Bacteroidales bacterium]|nr:ATP-grasp domain-containing protein [Bacteroidales bacterium]